MFDGRQESAELLLKLKKKIAGTNPKPGLAVILIGDDKSSEIYVNIKQKRALEIGVVFQKFVFPRTVSQAKISTLIKKLNQDKKIDGILLQLPLPPKFDTNQLINQIDPRKDVDGFFFGQRKKGTKSPLLVTILHFIRKSKKDLTGKKAVVVCHSVEFAESVQLALKQKKITTDILISPSKRTDLKKYDLVIVALGQRHWLRPENIKKNAILIDIGINRLPNSKKIYGDIDPKCGDRTPFLTPVPGGVGPMTVASLLKNLVQISTKK